MRLPMLAQDKANHFVYGVLVFLVAVLVVRHGAGLSAAAPAAAAAVVGLVAVGKERADAWLRDRQVRAGQAVTHAADWRDALATVAGGGAVWAAGF